MYYIYEKWQAGSHTATIYRASCPYCNDGRGLLGSEDIGNARWHGPFKTLRETRAVQAKMEVTDRRDCEFCMSDAQ